jgi:nucleotide-binding universal stress UspA family protein
MHKRILLPFDGSKYSEAALKEAIAMAKFSKGQIVIVTVVDVTEQFEALAPELTEKMAEHAKELVNRAAEKASAAGIKVEKEVHVGDAYEVIVDRAKEKDIDLIVMGSHGRRGLTRLLMGDVTAKVVGHAPCTVMVVRA